MTLSENEYNGLTKIARKTKCDCWFDIRQDKNGNDYVFDLESGKRLPLRTAIEDLFEAVLDPLQEYGLTEKEIDAVKGLMKDIGSTKRKGGPIVRNKPNGDIAIQSLDYCWSALCIRMRENPTEETQYVMNLLGRILTEAKCRTARIRKEEEKKITTQEWLKWLKSDND